MMTEPARIRVLGVHPVMEAPEPCHLVEIAVDGTDAPDFDAITQENPELPRAEWQVAYDERSLSETASTNNTRGASRYAFFFHYLDLSRPLLTANGLAALPPPSPMPAHLRFVTYEEP